MNSSRTSSAIERRRVFHYTLASTLLQIIAARLILRSDCGLSKQERPAVWFSLRPTWEPTATKGFLASSGEQRPARIDEMMRFGGALVRIEVAPAIAPYTWIDHLRLGLIDTREADALASAARRVGAEPADWRLTYCEVPTTDCLGVDASTDGQEWRTVGAFNGNRFSGDPDFVKICRRALQRPIG